MPNGSKPDPSSRWVVISLVKMVNSKTVNRLCLQFSLTTQSASQVWIHSFTSISWADGRGDLTGCHLPIRRGTQTSAFVLSDVFLLVYLLNFKMLCNSGHQWKWIVTWLLFSFNPVTAFSFHEVLKWKSSQGAFLWHFESIFHFKSCIDFHRLNWLYPSVMVNFSPKGLGHKYTKEICRWHGILP